MRGTRLRATIVSNYQIFQVVGAARFELTTYGTQNRRATRLRHAPRIISILAENSSTSFGLKLMIFQAILSQEWTAPAIFPLGPSTTCRTMASPACKSEKPKCLKISICKKISSLD